jgi:hypothetical protein
LVGVLVGVDVGVGGSGVLVGVLVGEGVGVGGSGVLVGVLVSVDVGVGGSGVLVGVLVGVDVGVGGSDVLVGVLVGGLLGKGYPLTHVGSALSPPESTPNVPWFANAEASKATCPVPSSKCHRPKVLASGAKGAVGGGKSDE